MMRAPRCWARHEYCACVVAQADKLSIAERMKLSQERDKLDQI